MASPIDLVLKHAPQWVARKLGFSDKRVERIESDYLEPERWVHVIIWKWLHNILSGRATRRFLNQAWIT